MDNVSIPLYIFTIIVIFLVILFILSLVLCVCLCIKRNRFSKPYNDVDLENQKENVDEEKENEEEDAQDDQEKVTLIDNYEINTNADISIQSKDHTNMRFLYIISTPEYLALRRFKFGIHKGPIKKLMTRYVTALPTVELILFYESDDALNIERAIKSEYKQYRIRNYNKRLSEWYETDLTQFIDRVKILINKRS